jgi:arginase
VPEDPRNLDQVVLVARAVADAVEATLAAGRLPVVFGGDCTISLGVMAGVLRRHPGSGLLYVDGDADLATPETSSSGVLDAMGAAHLLGLADNDLARIGPVFPMLTPERLVQFGYDETDPDSNRSDWSRELPGLTRFSGPEVRADPAGCALRALAALTAAADGSVVHFDVDTIDSRDLPLANFPHYHLGLPLALAADLLPGFYAQPHLRGAVFTEVNPSYDPSGRSLSRYVETVATALITGLAQAP